jgi:hypothetical protein
MMLFAVELICALLLICVALVLCRVAAAVSVPELTLMVAPSPTRFAVAVMLLLTDNVFEMVTIAAEVSVLVADKVVEANPCCVIAVAMKGCQTS